MTTPAPKSLRGVWPPLLLAFRGDGRIDLDVITAGTRHFARLGVHGVYTADTASEFYTLEFEEWNELATHFAAVAREHRLPMGVGCTWTNQAGILRRIARARELGYDNIHLSPPYWLPLNAAAERIFWRAVGEAAGDLAIVVYTGSKGQFPLDGPLLRRLREHCPAIAGTKSSGYDVVATNSLLVHCPDVSHFVGEQSLAFWMAMGAAGCFSNLIAFRPALMLRWFAAMEQGDWAEAFTIQRRVGRFYEEGVVPIRRSGYVIDKTLYVLGDVPGATTELRAPYASVPEDLLAGLRAAAQRHLTEL